MMGDDENEWQAYYKRERTARELFDGLGMNRRTANCLICNNILTIEELIQKRASDLKKMPHFGDKALASVEAGLARIGKSLVDETFGDELLGQLIEDANVTREALRKAGERHKAALARINARRMELCA